MNTINKINSCIILLGLAALPSGILPAQPKNIAPKPGMTIHGWVGSNNTGLPGVVVSDGFEVTTTDADGIYYLPSQKKHGYVFISIPGNYEAPLVNNIPQFFKHLKAHAGKAERADFILTPVDNDRHVVVVFGDTHLCRGASIGNRINVPSILRQFVTCSIDINKVIDSYKAAGTKTYLLTVGDMTRAPRASIEVGPFTLKDYVNVFKGFRTGVFHVIGNTDLYTHITKDYFDARKPWKEAVGPTYYSFNLGKAHYVVLDASQNIITDDQLEWLKKDLAAVADKSAPLIFAQHIPLYKSSDLNNKAPLSIKNGQQFIDCLRGFSNVLMLAGHTHANSRFNPSEYPWLWSHHVGTLSGSLFITGQDNWAKRIICPDGSPGGYGVYEIDGKNMQWYYKGVGFDRNYQFRTYDCNRTHITADKYAPSANEHYRKKVPAQAAPHHEASTANEIIINVWGYDTGWKIEVMEGSQSLPVTRMATRDPLSIISYDMQASDKNIDIPYNKTYTETHFFKARAKSPDSTLQIKVTDRFGNIYTETMKRPKELTLDMK